MQPLSILLRRHSRVWLFGLFLLFSVISDAQITTTLYSTANSSCPDGTYTELIPIQVTTPGTYSISITVNSSSYPIEGIFDNTTTISNACSIYYNPDNFLVYDDYTGTNTPGYLATGNYSVLVNLTMNTSFTVTVNGPGGVNLGVLPIYFGNFTAVLTSNGQVQLNWSTLMEENSSYFEIQRSRDGELFNTVGRVKASGNSNIQKDYSFLDEYPVTGTNYYKIKEFDLNGNYISTNIVQVLQKTGSDAIALTIAPNPASDYIYVQLNSAASGELQIIAPDGKMVGRYVVNASRRNMALPISQLSKGIYFLSLRSDKSITTISFVKQ